MACAGDRGAAGGALVDELVRTRSDLVRGDRAGLAGAVPASTWSSSRAANTTSAAITSQRPSATHAATLQRAPCSRARAADRRSAIVPL